MTTARVQSEVWPSTSSVTLVAIVCGLIALSTRSPGYLGVGVTAIVGLIGIVTPAPFEEMKTSVGQKLVVACAVMLAFVIAGMASPLPTGRLTALAAGAAIVAGVGEEAFFRKLTFGYLLRFVAAAAVLGSAAVFALVHIPGYGTRSVPVNLAAGLLFGWQRHTTGDWKVPAATHAAANVINLI